MLKQVVNSSYRPPPASLARTGRSLCSSSTGVLPGKFEDERDVEMSWLCGFVVLSWRGMEGGGLIEGGGQREGVVVASCSLEADA